MKRILITGGAGFIGVNTAYHFLAKGDKVTVFDNLSRNGTAANLATLRKTHRGVRFIHADIRDARRVEQAVRNQDVLFHLAGQVAVTTSVVNPREDFEINAAGTLNVLEAMRKHAPNAILLYSSTNKVYGNLAHVRVREKATRYAFVNRPAGIDETEPVDFHSPYGCSKGAGDQYVRDYHRMYGLKTVVFRQSCIYGPHQVGSEDQGWVVWFLMAALRGTPITIYGNGKQVRDILYVSDLLEAYDAAVRRIATTAGEIYNIGGGAKNTLSVWREFEPLIETLIGKRISVSYKQQRPGDQPIFIANTAKARRDFGWKPKIGYKAGIRQLYAWLLTSGHVLAGRP